MNFFPPSPPSPHLLVPLLALILGGCTGYPRILNFPFDTGGRSLNSLTAEVEPQISGNYITFTSDRNGSQDIYVYDANKRVLVDVPGLNALNEIASHPAISEDGQWIVFAMSYQGTSDIYIYDRQLQQKRNLTADLAAEVRKPTISADGSKIAFEVATDGQWDLQVRDRTGKIIAE